MPGMLELMWWAYALKEQKKQKTYDFHEETVVISSHLLINKAE